MIVKLGDYRVNYKFIETVLKRDNPQDIAKFIAIIAVGTYIPIIVVAHYIGEMIGFTPEVNNVITRMTQFYGYTKVIE